MADVDYAPNLEYEQALWAAGIRLVAGVDEAGRGALAGPLVAAAVVLPPDTGGSGIWSQVRDSKLLTPTRRQELALEIQSRSAAWAVGVVSAADVDECGVSVATRTAMGRAVNGLRSEPAHLLIDWMRLPDLAIAQTSWAKADGCSVSVAAASILAKVHRDRLLVEIDVAYPAFGFERHKGYGTPQHLSALSEHGPCPEHRLSFAPVARWRSLFDLSGYESRCKFDSEMGVFR
jgi:ribonuclease HII